MSHIHARTQLVTGQKWYAVHTHRYGLVHQHETPKETNINAQGRRPHEIMLSWCNAHSARMQGDPMLATSLRLLCRKFPTSPRHPTRLTLLLAAIALACVSRLRQSPPEHPQCRVQDNAHCLRGHGVPYQVTQISLREISHHRRATIDK